jgi:TPR repeat protein
VFLGYSAPWGSEEAMKWYGLAAEQGRVVAIVALADMHYDQLHGGDDSKAAWWYLKAVDRCTSGEELTGNDQAACKSDLDECLSRLGRISSQDKTAAAARFRLAASQGNRWAQGLLGSMYMTGSGVAQDYVEAVAWYRLAAEQGDVEAQYKLGLAHYHGHGVPQDYMEAEKRLRLAAEQGQATAQYNLALMYGLGIGVPKDDVQTHLWVNIAASRANGEDAERYVKLRDAAAAQMTPAQIAEAQRLAREWKPKTWKDLNPE